MGRFSPRSPGFTFGRLSPRLEGRDNIEQYFESLRQCENFVIPAQGLLVRRSGTRFLAATKNSTGGVRLLPFRFSVNEAFIVELGELYARFYTPAGRVESGGSPVEIATPFLASEVGELNFAQEGNLLYLTHLNHPPQILRRLTPTTFSLGPVVWRDGRAPMRPSNLDDDKKLTLSGAAPDFNILASAEVDDFVADDVGRFVRMSNNTVQRWFEITAVVDTKNITVQVRDELAAAPFTTATADWSLGATSATQGFRVVTFHEGRAIYGNAEGNPDRVWASNSDDFNFFEPRDEKGDANGEERSFTRRANSGEVNDILWMLPLSSRLAVGTAGGEFFLLGADDSIITNLSAIIRPTTQRGSEPAAPAAVDNDILFLQRGGRKLRRLTFQLANDAFESVDATVLAEDVLRPAATRLAYTQSPESFLWILRGDGKLVGVTLEKEQKVQSFHPHTLGGRFLGGEPVVLDIASIPDAEEDRLFVAVRRTINGGAVTHVEVLEPLFEPALDAGSPVQDRIDATEMAWFVDSGLQLDGRQLIEGVTNANPASVALTGHGFITGDRVRLRGLRGLTRLNRGRFTITRVDDDNFTLDNVDTSADPAWIAGGTAAKLVTAVAGLEHLEGETVSVLGDGAEQPDRIVTAGAVALEAEASVVTVGLPFRSFAETQRVTGGSRLGTDQGQRMRVQRVAARLMNTLGLKFGVGPNPENLQRVETRRPDGLMDEALPVFSGDIDLAFNSGWHEDPTVFMEQTAPLPASVLAVYPRAESNER